MSVLALVTKWEEAELVTTWASEFASACDTDLIVLCWARARVGVDLASADELGNQTVDQLAAKVQRLVTHPASDEQSWINPLPADKIQVLRLLHPDAATAALQQIKEAETELVVAASEDQTGATGATYATNRLLRQSPCNTIMLFGSRRRLKRSARVFVGTVDNPNDVAAVYLAARMAESSQTQVTIARSERYHGEGALEIGHRELRQLLRDAGVKTKGRVTKLVVRSSDVAEVAGKMDEHDLVMVGANNQEAVERILNWTDTPVVAAIKRAPPLRVWRRTKGNAEWNPRLSPADYVDLVQGLRRGSRLNADFLVMLGLAAAIATLGLLQDSAAVVIGSMLLAPLMTPMIASGLALAQANAQLGLNSLKSIAFGFILTLVVSCVTALLTPGVELSSQVLARGTPNILDLLIALFSAFAAAYALARPNLVGAVAGVAIATALVPPLCSTGIAIVYHQYSIALGAALLFLTNLVAIVLGAAITFRYLGVTSREAGTLPRRWTYRAAALLAILLITLAIPLHFALKRNIELGKSQPATYPLTQAVQEAVTKHVKTIPGVALVAAGRPSSLHDKADVIIFITSPSPLPASFGQEIVDIVRREMRDNTLVVEVHCLQQAWQPQAETEEKKAATTEQEKRGP